MRNDTEFYGPPEYTSLWFDVTITVVSTAYLIFVICAFPIFVKWLAHLVFTLW